MLHELWFKNLVILVLAMTLIYVVKIDNNRIDSVRHTLVEIPKYPTPRNQVDMSPTIESRISDIETCEDCDINKSETSDMEKKELPDTSDYRDVPNETSQAPSKSNIKPLTVESEISPKIMIDTPDYRVEGSLLDNKKYVIIGATMPRREKQLHYTWYIPVTARIWASKGHIPLVFLAGNYSEWMKNILGRTAVESIRKIPNVVLVFFTCKEHQEITMAQVIRIVGVGNMIDVSNAENSFFITTDIDLWPLNMTKHTLPEDKDILISRALSGLKGCCHVSIALSCVGMKGKTWRALTQFDDCNEATTNQEAYQKYCTEQGVLINDRHGQNGTWHLSKHIRTKLDSADKIMIYLREFLDIGVDDANEGKSGETGRETWFADQSLATMLVRYWHERNIRTENATSTTVMWPKKVDRVDRGKGWSKLREENFDPNNYQDTHLPAGVQYSRPYNLELVPFLEFLISQQEIDVITEYQKTFESRIPQWRLDLGIPTVRYLC